MALSDPKGAPHDIVQAIGRALRQKPGQGKVASLIVPVFLQPGEQPEDMFTSGSYRPLVKVLEGLRAHDEEAVELLAIPQEPRKADVQPSTHIGSAPEDGEEESRLLLRFAAPRDPVMVADWVSFTVIDTEKQDWARSWAALKKFTEREQNARVPYGHKKGAYPLGAWVAEQRRAYGAGQMSGLRARRLEKLGMVWSVADERFQENLEAAKAYYADHCSEVGRGPGQAGGAVVEQPAPPRCAGGSPGVEGRAAGRRPGLGPQVAGGVAAALRRAARAGGRRRGPGGDSARVTVHAMDIGKSLARQRTPSVWQALHDGQRERLEQLGITPLAPTPEPEAPTKPSTAPMSAFDKGVAALAQYKAREGTVTVPRNHVERLEDGTEVKLGVFLSNSKSRRAKLPSSPGWPASGWSGQRRSAETVLSSWMRSSAYAVAYVTAYANPTFTHPWVR
ncbi:helicase associated domain-containing protein [Streptomyces bobili]|uniref:helicase associated domain-containing protein n=1 Tax=Streptomyces bobili TaxID=67280 RepID=UPI0037A038CE